MNTKDIQLLLDYNRWCNARILGTAAKLTDEQFLAPGRRAINVERPGKVVIWHDQRTVFQGRSYDSPDRLPAGARIRAIEEASGRELEVGATFGASSASGNSRRVAIAQFRAEQPGRHLVLVEGTFEPRVFSAGADFLPRLLMAKEATVAGMMLPNMTADEWRTVSVGVRAALADGTLTPVVSRELPLAEAPKAHEAVLAGGAHGKIVLVP